MTVPCPGCGGRFAATDGPTHAYMLSSPGCWHRYGLLLAREYAEPALLPTHRLSVDAYAVQHPGRADERRAIQSVWLHLGRLMLQLGGRMARADTHAAMLALNRVKATVPPLEPPTAFTVTMADVPVDAPTAALPAAVTAWAAAAWDDWRSHHEAVRRWVAQALA